ncbi:hypothetical protein HCN51_31435 [Nonomuraea sp. FMUSA5-5]|uniref:Uncharacterized protein n=1 Tax=Nonomuraea composti TaxID=2720023 RepID=A0ABX1B7V1_9ACTN|nr:hypothetical protein [Nonomuraea sp. FMUSA5-5]NJP93900.1 hypothetical protein [Nonomuraea sp. FMUSA5-5]
MTRYSTAEASRTTASARPWPASTVARFAPGGSTVEQVTPATCRLTLGAWSWPGPAGLRQALHALRTRITTALRHSHRLDGRSQE